MSDRGTPFPNHDALARALRRAHSRMRRIHAATGMPLVMGTDDRVVYRDPTTLDEIPADQVEAFIERAKRALDE